MVKPKADVLFEVSWEICNKVGGIWTVITSKAQQISERYKDKKYFCIGPYFADKVAGQFLEEAIPEEIKQLCDELANEGIIIHYGKWLIKGEPETMLIDFENFKGKTDEIKGEMWNEFKVDTLNSPYEFNEPFIWAYAAGKVIEKLSHTFSDKKIVAQFHEWLSGNGILYLKKSNSNVKTVFTTHATILGRSIASSDVELYEIMDKIDPEKEAYNYHIPAKYQTEKQAALNADVFSTVSEITGMEAENLLKKKPDILLPNGLDIGKFPSFEDISIKHRLTRDKIREFLSYYFFPYYSVDLKQSLIFFLAGRYEFKDKGIDIYIKALARLNDKLKEKNNTKKTIFAFIWVPSKIRGMKTWLVENRTIFNDIKDALEDEIDVVKRDILYTILTKKGLTKENVFEKEFLEETKKRMMRFTKKGSPDLVTHELLDESNDIIFKTLMDVGLDNQEDDKVKVIFYPTYLTGADGLLDLSYYECMQGSHLGVFPSYYEPWGYTPLEAAALGVPSVTTDLAGFGRYIKQYNEDKKHPGIYVLERMEKKEEDIIEDLANFMYDYSQHSQQDRVKDKMAAKKLSASADWKNLADEYIKAHDMALEK